MTIEISHEVRLCGLLQTLQAIRHGETLLESIPVCSDGHQSLAKAPEWTRPMSVIGDFTQIALSKHQGPVDNPHTIHPEFAILRAGVDTNTVRHIWQNVDTAKTNERSVES